MEKVLTQTDMSIRRILKLSRDHDVFTNAEMLAVVAGGLGLVLFDLLVLTTPIGF
jgi:hypothetical protein